MMKTFKHWTIELTNGHNFRFVDYGNSCFHSRAYHCQVVVLARLSNHVFGQCISSASEQAESISKSFYRGTANCLEMEEVTRSSRS